MDADRLDEFLAQRDLDGYLLHDDSSDADQRYLSGFDAPDQFLTLYDGDVRLLVSGLEYGRARRQSRAADVRRFADYDQSPYGDPDEMYDAVAAFLAEFDADAVAVPDRFPLGTADGLRNRDVSVAIDEEGAVTQVRATKADHELDHVRAAQRANEAAMTAAVELIGAADIDGDTLRYEGDELTAERVKEEIEIALLRRGCGLDETIVAGAEQGADPHERGSGPLPAHEPIVIDIFPRSKETKYHADMTRTVVRGEADEDVRRRFEVTREALDAALDAVEPGATGEAVHDAVCDVYEREGYATLRSDPDTETGFIHSTGHGVGLDVHELPRVGPGGAELEPGNVITIEPGLYDPAVGGLRLEDIVAVTRDGHENLTDYPLELEI